MVAIPHEQASGACPSNSKLKLIRDNFKDVKLGKISTRDRKEMGGSCDYGEEDSSEQTRGMLYEGEFHGVKMIQFAEAKISGTILIKAT